MDEAAPPPTAPQAVDRIPTDPESSFELVIRAREGDQQAMDELFERYLPRLRSWAHGRLPRAARGAYDTQDLVQVTLTKVFRRLKDFEPRHPGAFRDYVWTTLWNSLRDIARSCERHPTDALETETPGSLPSPFEEAMGRETMERYERALERLRPIEREAIIARIELGLSYADVAAALGKPTVGAAHVAVSRALVRLAEEMAHDRRTKR
jgi:RNA polymerase sigma-70 factor (ECF subfamily)